MDIKQPYTIYLPALTERARELRKQETCAEKLLWTALRGKRVLGYKFTRQKPILGYIVDFYCSELLLIIEVDGSSHDAKREYDETRTQDICVHGFHIKRYQNEEIENSLSTVIENLTQYIKTILPSR